MKNENSSKRFYSIDCLRGIAALGVMIRHAFSPIDGFSDPAWYEATRSFVDLFKMRVPLFFALSGFFIHLYFVKSCLDPDAPRISIFEIAKRRFRRIYPPYLITVIGCSVLLFGLYLLYPNLGQFSKYPDPKLNWIVGDVFSHLFFLHGLHPIFDRGLMNLPLWTIARQEYFFLLYFLILPIRIRFGWKTTTMLIIGAATAYALVLGPHIPSGWREQWVTKSALMFFIQWWAGALAAEIGCGLIKNPAWMSRGWIVMAGMVAFPLIRKGRLVSHLTPLFAALLCLIVILYVLNLEKNGRWPVNRMTQWLSGVGLFSYSIYLVHTPIKNLIEVFSRNMLPLELDAARLLVAVLDIVVGYLAAKLFYQIVERRFIRRSINQQGVPIGGNEIKSA